MCNTVIANLRLTIHLVAAILRSAVGSLHDIEHVTVQYVSRCAASQPD